MEVHTTEPVVINYSGYYMDLLLKDKKCKDGVVYQRSGGLLFMPQGYPDAVNHVSLVCMFFISLVIRQGFSLPKQSLKSRSILLDNPSLL